MDYSTQSNFKRARKANFSNNEMVALLEGIEANQDVIFAANCNGVTQRKKRAAWEAITARVNACCVAVRTQLELRDKWKGMKSAVLTRQKQNYHMSGDGPLSKEIPFESMIWRIINKNSYAVNGTPVEGSDTSLNDRMLLQSQPLATVDADGAQPTLEATQLPLLKLEPDPEECYTGLRDSPCGDLATSNPKPSAWRQYPSREVDAHSTAASASLMQLHANVRASSVSGGAADSQADLPTSQASSLSEDHEGHAILDAPQTPPLGGDYRTGHFLNGLSPVSSMARQGMVHGKLHPRKPRENRRRSHHFDGEDDDEADEEESYLYASYLQSEIEKNVALKMKLHVEKQVLKATYKKTLLEIKLLERKLGNETTDEDSGIPLDCLSE